MKRLLLLLSSVLIGFVPALGAQAQQGRELPDFADLVEKVGPAVAAASTSSKALATRTRTTTA